MITQTTQRCVRELRCNSGVRKHQKFWHLENTKDILTMDMKMETLFQCKYFTHYFKRLSLWVFFASMLTQRW